jgi:superfamily II DNA or RNA helicase/HKD family nuclease/diadenosine tetraphosphate (Ap4A) HIT family hydrolase
VTTDDVRSCPFCQPAAERIFYASELVLGVWDAFPVSDGHALLVPKRHVAGWFDATREERRALIDAVDVVRERIQARYTPDGYNIGVNVGEAAGQTIFHLHVHVIPRYAGDVADPRGGVRHVVPARANYLAAETASLEHVADASTGTGTLRRDRALELEPALVAGLDDPLLPHLRTALDGATRADVAVAFVLARGVELVEDHLVDLLERGGRLRILTGDYLGCTDPVALRRLLDLAAGCEDRVELRVFETGSVSFHPKAYITYGNAGEGVAFVGSSNLTDMALRRGVEWNYRVVTSHDARGFAAITRAFERLFHDRSTKHLTSSWIDTYAERRRVDSARARAPGTTEAPRSATEPSDIAAEPIAPPPAPHEIQQRALAALEQTRREGNSAGLVVLGTGLGKTWLAAFDSNRAAFRRVLFVAHREEILRQAMQTFRRIRPDSTLGLYMANERSPNAEIVFASIQTIGRARHLEAFAPDAFDYIVVDEFHHAAARTYLRLLEHFEPTFLLGLTATPERTDGGDLLALCQENLVFRCDFPEGIQRGLLAPFKYFGVPDVVDYRNIPWRSSRFDEEALTQAVATHERARNALEQYRSHGGKKTLAFCCSMRHANFMRRFFADAGVSCAAVHSGPESDPRAASLEKLRSGEIAVLFTVDMFNEGVDLPSADTILMLRPTESRILWLQQFGRGLRQSDDKDHLTVVDYIGNHRSFLMKPQALLGLGEGDAHVERALRLLASGEAELPPGCEVTYELEAINILRSLLRRSGDDDALRLYYEDFRERRGTRPRAAEAFHDGYSPAACRRSHGSWLGFVRAMGDLDDIATVVGGAGAARFLETLETTAMSKSYKMLVLQSMLEAGSLPGSISIDDLTIRLERIARRSAVLTADVGDAIADRRALRRHIETNPIAAWCGGRATDGMTVFSYDGVTFTSTLDIPEDRRDAFADLVREIVEWRLAQYLTRPAVAATASGRVECSVSHAEGRPIIFLPPRDDVAGIPSGWTPVIIDGVEHEANFVKVAVNVVRRPGADANVLPEILRGWFGADAGRPGTRHRVMFESTEAGWTLRPLTASSPVSL